MTAVDISFACVIVFLAVCIMAGVGVIVAALCRPIATADAYGMCAPTRRASITASQPQAQRRVVLASVAVEYAVPRPVDVDAIRANSRTYDLAALAAPEELPLAVPNWPTRQTVEADPVPVVVNRTAARFASLEIGGKR